MKKSLFTKLIAFICMWIPLTMMAGPDKDLEKAINRMDAEGMKKAIAAGADINKKSMGTPLLFTVVGLGRMDMIQIMLDSKVDVKATDIGGHSVLAYLSIHVKSAAETAKWWQDYYKKYMKKDTVFAQGVFGTHAEIGLALCKAGADVNEKQFFGMTPMQTAMEKGHIDLVKIYLDHGFDINQRLATLDSRADKTHLKFGLTDPEKHPTAIMIAVGLNNPEMVKMFIEKGADLNMIKHEYATSGGEGVITYHKMSGNVLSMARRIGNEQIIQMLVNAGAKE